LKPQILRRLSLLKPENPAISAVGGPKTRGR
jgi:hypothetical protein